MAGPVLLGKGRVCDDANSRALFSQEFCVKHPCSPNSFDIAGHASMTRRNTTA
jgi:hypothetical protein